MSLASAGSDQGGFEQSPMGTMSVTTELLRWLHTKPGEQPRGAFARTFEQVPRGILYFSPESPKSNELSTDKTIEGAPEEPPSIQESGFGRIDADLMARVR